MFSWTKEANDLTSLTVRIGATGEFTFKDDRFVTFFMDDDGYKESDGYCDDFISLINYEIFKHKNVIDDILRSEDDSGTVDQLNLDYFLQYCVADYIVSGNIHGCPYIDYSILDDHYICFTYDDDIKLIRDINTVIGVIDYRVDVYGFDKNTMLDYSTIYNYNVIAPIISEMLDHENDDYFYLPKACLDVQNEW